MKIREYKSYIHTCAKLLHSESGTTAIEYTMIAALVSIAAISAIDGIGTATANNVFGAIAAVR